MCTMNPDLTSGQRLMAESRHMGVEVKVAADKLDRLEAENAKLRELVKAFDWCTENFDLLCKCDSCPLGQSDKLTPECEVRMRELGIEVEE